jgi:hypothetical protein
VENTLDDSWKWFHRTTHTCGAWLYGDPRGFRTRHHREHVEGDYKDPPPKGKYDWKYQRSKKLLKQPPVVLSREWRPVIGEALRDRLQELGALLLAISVGGQHVHFQARMPPPCPREWTGIAKKHAWFIARDNGWTGMLWAKRSKANPVKDRGHQENVFRYILDHAKEGAWVWHFRMRPPTHSPPAAAGGL